MTAAAEIYFDAALRRPGAVPDVEALVSGSVAGDRLMLVLVGIFALSALTIAAVGLFGLVAFAVAARTREIGIRSAPGAGSHAAVRLLKGRLFQVAVLACYVPARRALRVSPLVALKAD